MKDALHILIHILGAISLIGLSGFAAGSAIAWAVMLRWTHCNRCSRRFRASGEEFICPACRDAETWIASRRKPFVTHKQRGRY